MTWEPFRCWNTGAACIIYTFLDAIKFPYPNNYFPHNPPPPRIATP